MAKKTIAKKKSVKKNTTTKVTAKKVVTKKATTKKTVTLKTKNKTSSFKAKPKAKVIGKVKAKVKKAANKKVINKSLKKKAVKSVSKPALMANKKTTKQTKTLTITKKVDYTKAITPLADRLVVRRLESEKVTAGGIIIPDTAKEKPQKGEVVATGKGRINEDGKVFPLEVKAGDKVLFSKYAGTDLKFGTEDYLMITENDVLGILN